MTRLNRLPISLAAFPNNSIALPFPPFRSGHDFGVSSIFQWLMSMLQNHSQSASILDPEDLKMLQKVFDELCERRRFGKGSPGATRIAQDLIDLFQHGIRGERQLLMILSGAKTFP
jgi:hypothetical protein